MPILGYRKLKVQSSRSDATGFVAAKRSFAYLVPLIKLYTSLRSITGEKEITTNAQNIKEVIAILKKLFGNKKNFEEHLKSSSIFVNGKNVLKLSGVKTKLSEKDEVHIFPPVGGGN